jgi:hypothetical protein
MSTLLLISVLISAGAHDGVELGLIVGEPTGLSGKLWTGAGTAIDCAVAWSMSSGSHMHIHADFLIHDWNLLGSSDGTVPFYYGIGGRIVLADDTRLGARVPVGIGYYPSGISIGLFLELVPVLDLLPDTELDMDAAIGIRYVF